jgi:DNA-binding FadR family transcriptional regulator
VSRHDLFEARMAIELTCARLAAERADEDAVAALRDLANVIPSTAAELAENSAAFHKAVAAASGNPALHLFVQVLYSLTVTAVDHQAVMPVAGEVHHVHAAIAEAIAAGDGAIAQRRMMRHFEAMTAVEGITT